MDIQIDELQPSISSLLGHLQRPALGPELLRRVEQDTIPKPDEKYFPLNLNIVVQLSSSGPGKTSSHSSHWAKGPKCIVIAGDWHPTRRPESSSAMVTWSSSILVEIVELMAFTVKIRLKLFVILSLTAPTKRFILQDTSLRKITN